MTTYEELKKKNIELGARVGGYAKQNKQLRQTNKTLREDLERLHEELLENKSRYKEKIEKYEEFDKRNSDSINSMYMQIADLKKQNEELRNQNCKAGKLIKELTERADAFFALPWYKRVFARSM